MLQSSEDLGVLLSSALGRLPGLSLEESTERGGDARLTEVWGD